MGANAATKCYKVVENVHRILAIELLNGAQALEFRRPMQSSTIIEKTISEYRKIVPFIEADQVLYIQIEKSILFLKSLNFKF